MKRKVTLRILLQRASNGEKKQRILKRKWPWSGVPRSFDLGYNGFTRYSDKVYPKFGVLDEVCIVRYK